MVVKSEKRGTIRKIVFKNFLTYEDETIEPEPNLNVIIGCNGTGKSTIMCGIYLACGGNPKDLGRSERFGDYVKHGKESGSVELTVCTRDAGVCSVLKIVVNKPNSAEFYIDDRKHSAEGVQRFARKNKFQIDNPCAFLAQDKVKSFAEQSAQELLINTEKAVSPILFAKHSELIASRNNGHNVVQLCDQLEATVKRTRDEIGKLDDLVKNYHDRVVMDKRISLLEKKRAMMLYDEMKRLYDECGERRKTRRNELKSAEEQLAPIELEVKQAEREQKLRLNTIRKSVIDDVVGKLHFMRDEKVQRVHRCHRDAADVRDTIRQIADINAELKAEIDKIEARKGRIEATKTEIAMLKTQLDGCNANDDNLKQQMREIDKQYDAICRQISSFDVELRTCASNREQLREQIYRSEMREREFSRFESTKLQQLFSQNPRAIDAWKWYCENRDQFTAPVYIAAMSMRLISQEAIAYLMTAIGARDLQMFIFACAADEARLQAQCKSQRWKINSTVVTASDVQNSNANGRPLPVLLREYGFQGFASDLFEAPDAVVAYLNGVCQLNTVPIGGEEVDRNFNKIADNPAITKQYRLYLTKTERIFFKYSRYSSDMITKREDLRQQRPLLWYNDRDQQQYGNGYVDKDGEKRQMAILDQQSNELNGKKMEHTRQQNQLRVEKNNLQQQMGDRRRIENDINSKTQRLDRLLQEGTNVDTIRRRVATQVTALVDKAYSTVEKVTDRLQNTTSELDQIAIDSLEYEQMIRRSRHRRREYHRRKAELVDLSTEVRNIETEYNQLVEQMRDRIAATLRVVQFDTLNATSMNDETRRRYNEMWKQFKDENIPVELAEVKLQLAREQARLQAASSEGNEQHIARYEECKRELATAERQLIEERERKETWRENLQKEIDEWREHLGRLVRRLNENYSAAFKLLGDGTAGEIRLQPASDQLDTAKYGIDIMVKFREHEPLRRLTAKVQSGGERSVSTMLYLMALQQISALPFCCVDEINQGMDPSNERRVFNMMVDLLSGNMARTQYFMLTPKLLPELKFNDRVNILVVHNGPSMITGEQFDFETIIAAAKAARHH